MGKDPRIHAGKQPRRPHYIPEWAEHRGFTNQAELVEALGCDKSTVSRWYDGATPSEHWQAALADLFKCERESLFRHPMEDWLWRFFRGRPVEDLERAKALLEITFPKRTGTNG